MIYLDLFLGFLQVGLFSFGGAYGAIPVIREVVLSHDWGITEEKFAYLLAISESTPGPIMVNTATFIGREAGGLAGSVIATCTVCLPAFLIILLLSILLRNALQNPYVQAAFNGIKPCITGIILATGLYMIAENCFPAVMSLSALTANWRAFVLSAVLIAVTILYKKARKKSLPPILLIAISAILGILFYGV